MKRTEWIEAKVLLGILLLAGAPRLRAAEPAPVLQAVTAEAKGFVPAGETSALQKDKPLQSDPLLAGADRFAEGASNVTEVNLDKSMLAMAAKFIGKDDGEGQALMKKMDFVYVRSYEYAKPGGYRLGDVDQFRGRLDEAQWSHAVKERSATEATDVWIKADSEGRMSELLVIAAEPTELTFVHLKGRMSMEELTKAGASYGVPQTDGKLKKRGK